MNRFYRIDTAYNYRKSLYEGFMKKISLLLIVSFIFALIFAQEGEQSSFIFKMKVHEYRLNNGLKLLVVQRDTPTVSCQLWFDVGSVNDPEGLSGAAHLFEHMMFKGTRIIGTKNYEEEKPLLDETVRIMRLHDSECMKDEPDYAVLEALKQEYSRVVRKLNEIQMKREFWDILEMQGATEINASTSFDWTEYHYSLPANKLEVWAWIERDRLKNLVLREFYAERDVVLEEMRTSLFDSAWGRVYAELRAIAFIEHPYRRPIIGFRRDIRFADPDELLAHLKRHYVPMNCVAVVVGGVKPDEVYTLVERYFGDIENPSEPPPKPKAVEPEQNSERRAIIRAPFKKRLILGFHRPELTNPDFAPLELLTLILSYGRSSRLYKALVKEKKLAASVDCWNRDSKYPDLFIIRALPTSEHTNAEVEAAVLAEIEKVKKEGVTASELEQAKKKSLFGIASALDSNSSIAWQLGYYQCTAGDWRFIYRAEENIKKVTKEDIIRVANKYFKPSNMSVVYLEESSK